jgi:hypothetical protein
MKLLLAGLLAMGSVFVAVACEATRQYDGVSRFADSSLYGAYYGPGSPPREAAAPGNSS